MNKNNTISKVITGGSGTNDLDIKNKLQTKDLIVSGSLTLPNNSLTISQVANLQDNLNNIQNNITPLINASNSNITNLIQATTNITYNEGYTNIPFLYVRNNLLMFDEDKESNTDVLLTLNTHDSQITTNSSDISFIKTQVSSQNTRISTNTTDIVSIRGELDTTKTSIVNNYPTKQFLSTTLLDYATLNTLTEYPTKQF